MKYVYGKYHILLRLFDDLSMELLFFSIASVQLLYDIQ